MVRQHQTGAVLGDRLRDGLKVIPVMGDALGLAIVTSDVAIETAVFEGIQESIGQARQFVTAALPGTAWADIVVSELATNAIPSGTEAAAAPRAEADRTRAPFWARHPPATAETGARVHLGR